MPCACAPLPPGLPAPRGTRVGGGQLQTLKLRSRNAPTPPTPAALSSGWSVLTLPGHRASGAWPWDREAERSRPGGSLHKRAHRSSPVSPRGSGQAPSSKGFPKQVRAVPGPTDYRQHPGHHLRRVRGAFLPRPQPWPACDLGEHGRGLWDSPLELSGVLPAGQPAPGSASWAAHAPGRGLWSDVRACSWQRHLTPPGP